MVLKLDFKCKAMIIIYNRLFFGVVNAFAAQNKFVIDEISWCIREPAPHLKTEEMLNRRLNSKKPLNVSYLKEDVNTLN